MASLSIGARKDLTDRQWRILEPLLPRGKRPGRPPKWTRRQLLNGIRWRTRVGAPWRDVPERYGHWQSIYGLFRRWQRAQVWPLIVAKLQAFADAAGLICWTVSVDSTINRAHQHAAGARHDPDTQVEPPGPEPADHALGRSRGGWTTKLHLACEQGRKPLSLVLTAGQRADSPQFAPVLAGIRVPKCGPGRSGPGRRTKFLQWRPVYRDFHGLHSAERCSLRAARLLPHAALPAGRSGDRTRRRTPAC